MESPHFLLCPPDYFDAHFLFNPWLSYTDTVDKEEAYTQWRALKHAILRAGGVVQELPPSRQESAMVYTRDNALVYAPKKVLLLRSVGPRGLGEPKRLRIWFEEQGYEVTELPKGMHLEGGNLLFRDAGTLLAGYKEGEDVAAYRWFVDFYKRATGQSIKIIFVKLQNEKYLHLDMAVSFLGETHVLVYPPALNLGPTWRDAALWQGRMVVALDETEYFGANVVRVNNTIITASMAESTRACLTEAGYAVASLNLSEFIKGGGGPHCLTLDL